MEDLPGNSHMSKEAPKITEPAVQPKVGKVIQGTVTQRKKPLGRKFMETYFGTDAKSVGMHVLMDVIIPASKNAISDGIETAVNQMLFGGSRPSGRRIGSGGAGIVNYNRPLGGLGNKPDPRQPQMSRQARATHNFEEIVFEKRGDAEQVLDGLYNLITTYDQATVADLYGMVDITPTPQDLKWGWTNLSSASIDRLRGGGFAIDMPRPEALR